MKSEKSRVERLSIHGHHRRILSKGGGGGDKV